MGSALNNALEKDLSKQEEDLVMRSTEKDLNIGGSEPKTRQNSTSASPFEPWMIVKKAQRRRSEFQGSRTKSSIPNNSIQEDQDPTPGSRFSLLQSEETEGNNETNEVEISMPISSPQPVLQIKEQRIRNPAAEKNPQNVPTRKQIDNKPNQPSLKKSATVSRSHEKSVVNAISKPSPSNQISEHSSSQVDGCSRPMEKNSSNEQDHLFMMKLMQKMTGRKDMIQQF
ncbi:hypothetical protein SESBI_40599 [Sesbania bispinosa]|nr:hypothetical protein SESBI_40599 [Sesbania bispinosa]